MSSSSKLERVSANGSVLRGTDIIVSAGAGAGDGGGGSSLGASAVAGAGAGGGAGVGATPASRVAAGATATGQLVVGGATGAKGGPGALSSRNAGALSLRCAGSVSSGGAIASVTAGGERLVAPSPPQ